MAFKRFGLVVNKLVVIDPLAVDGADNIAGLESGLFRRAAGERAQQLSRLVFGVFAGDVGIFSMSDAPNGQGRADAPGIVLLTHC